MCATCGRLFEFSGHVNLDLDLRLHRENDGCTAAGVVYRKTKKADLVRFDRETEQR